MLGRGPSRYLALAIGFTLLALLAVLATLQYRWIGQGSVLESHRLRVALFSSGAQLTADFDREITRAFLAFLPPAAEGAEPELAGRLGRQYERWLAEAPYPGLVREVFHLHRGGAEAPALEVLRLDPPRLETAPWPAELAALRRRLSAPDAPPFAPIPAVEPGSPGLILPADWTAVRASFGRERRRTASAGSAGADHVLLWLDLPTIAREILPELMRRHFGSAQGTQDAVAVFDRDDPARALFLSDPRLPAASFRSGDLVLPLFALRRFDDLRSGPLPPAAATRGVRGTRGAPGSGAAFRGGGRGGDGAWKLVVRRRNGSLEEAVAGYRHRNLAISAAILALLAASTGLMMAATQRARRLARQQMEFVAAVSHELRTPVAAILSAGQNLAAGVVAEPVQVKRYGELIEREGRRLSAMVGQVLDFAGLEAGRQPYTLQATEVGPVVDAALDDCRGLLAERQARVERDVAPGLPPVHGDPAALRQAVRNLIENAAKYGGPDPWIGVRARPAGHEVEITVADRGMGVERGDVPRLFEPFFRGREAIGRSIAGSGLGLSVVRHIARAHRGRVSCATGGAGRGSAFTLHLPAAEPVA